MHVVNFLLSMPFVSDVSFRKCVLYLHQVEHGEAWVYLLALICYKYLPWPEIHTIFRHISAAVGNIKENLWCCFQLLQYSTKLQLCIITQWGGTGFDWNLASSLVSRGQNGVWPRETTSSPGSCVRKEEREPGTQNFFTHVPSSLGNLHTAPLH